ncbi:hypothetical protein BGZ73_007419 [Actinomortierella ambigua]|nr:hypothetical protein BGZ73_007419 [Actinomortierella ambigua]
MAAIHIDPSDPLVLHKAIFLNRPQSLRMYLAPYAAKKDCAEAAEAKDSDARPSSGHQHHPYINHLDHRHQSPLHLAIMLNRKEMVELLLQSGANPLIRSGLGWIPRQEATSLGDRQLIGLLTRYHHRTISGSFKERATGLVKKLSQDLDQFYFQLQWEFQCWVGFENLKWIRGHISIIFHVDPEQGPELVLVDRVKKIVQRLARSSDEEKAKNTEPSDEEVEREVSLCLCSDIVATNIPTSAISFTRAKSGLWGYRAPKTEKIGQYECSVWKMEGIEFRTRTRTEHLKDENGNPIPPLSKKQLQHHKRKKRAKKGDKHEGLFSQQQQKKNSHIRPSPNAQHPVAHDHPHHEHEAASVAVMHRSSPRHQPLFPVEPMVPKESPASNDQTTALVATTPDQTDSNIQTQGGGVLKKHTRSVGTISDDAYFEQALKEAEGNIHVIGGDTDHDTENEEESEEEEDDDDDIPYRPSLPPPPPPTVTFEEYFDPSNSDSIHLGRPLEMKETRKSFGATLWMYEDSSATSSSSATAKSNYLTAPSTSSKNGSTTSVNSLASAGTDVASISSSAGSQANSPAPPASPSQRPAQENAPAQQRFPLTIDRIIPLLEVVGMDNNRLVGKLREFLEYKLPPGFPIRANIPLYPSLSADVTFVNFDSNRKIEDDLFEIPGASQGYMEGFVIRHLAEDPDESAE